MGKTKRVENKEVYGKDFSVTRNPIVNNDLNKKLVQRGIRLLRRIDNSIF